jgi:hypothetical protein
VLDLRILELPALALLLLCPVFTLVSRNWRWSIFSLALQYVGVMVLIAGVWPILMALTKLIAGWIAGAVLSTAIQDLPVPSEEDKDPAQILQVGKMRVNMVQLSASLFGLLAATMVALVVISITPMASVWVPGITSQLAAAGLLLIGLGALQLGMTAHPFRVTLGLLTVLSGFEIIYAAVEKSLLVAGLLSGVTLGLALVGSYLIHAPDLGP